MSKSCLIKMRVTFINLIVQMIFKIITSSSIDETNRTCLHYVMHEFHVVCDGFHVNLGHEIDFLIEVIQLIFDGHSFTDLDIIKFSIISQRYNREYASVTLSLMDIQFSQKTFELNFYKGKNDINELRFISSAIDCISSPDDSNNNLVFYAKLKIIAFFYCTINEITENSFNQGNLEIVDFVFTNVQINRMDPTFFHSHWSTLDRLSIIPLPNDLSLNDIFNVKHNSPLKIRQLTIVSSSKKFHLLAAKNFSSLSKIEFLDVSKSGVEIIEPNTFDHIKNTLTVLRLEGNNLTNLNYRMFYPLINNAKGFITLNLQNNPTVCSCSFYELQNVFYWMLKSMDLSPDMLFITMRCYKDVTNQIHLSHCPAMQVINLEKFGMNEEVYMYPKFIIKLDQAMEEVIVITDVARSYRLWAHNLMDTNKFNSKWGYTQQKCQLNGYADKNIRCISLSNAVERVPLAVFKDAFGDDLEMIQVCVNYVSVNPKKMWPLHCITINGLKSGNEERDHYDSLVWLWGFGAGLLGACFLVLMLGLVYCFARN